MTQITESFIQDHLTDALAGVDLPFLGPKISGKVREIYEHTSYEQTEVDENQLIIITTDRLSAFDRILGLVPFKGQVLNQLAAFWFEQTRDIVDNHLIAVPDPNVTVARRCDTLPIEVVVRGYISGVTSTALWYQYDQGNRTIYGIDFPDGLSKNDPLPEPVITPTTKASDGGHDERITNEQVTSMGLVGPQMWAGVQETAIALFKRGQEIASRAGLILVDTKYEFGVSPEGNIVLIDEAHTPDSSRFWIADTYEARLNAGHEPENFDKEFVRLHYATQGYRGDGEPFPLPDDLAVQAALRYIRTYEMLTGETFVPGEVPAEQRIERNLKSWLRNAIP